MAGLTLEELTAQTIGAAHSLTLKPGQDEFIKAETFIALEQQLDPAGSWPRVVRDGDEVVGYLMATFDPHASEDYLRAALWKLIVRADAQGKGVGRFAVKAFADEARKLGLERVTAVWPADQDGPAAYFEKIGFVEIGQTPYGEKIGAHAL